MWKIFLYILIGTAATVFIIFISHRIFYWISRWQMKGWLRELDTHLGNKFNNLKKEENGTEEKK